MKMFGARDQRALARGVMGDRSTRTAALAIAAEQPELARESLDVLAEKPALAGALGDRPELVGRLVAFARTNPAAARGLVKAGRGAAEAPIAAMFARDPELVKTFLDVAPSAEDLARVFPDGPGAAARVDRLVAIGNQRPALARSALALTKASPRTWGVFADALDRGIVEAAVDAPGELAEHVVGRALARPKLVGTFERALANVPSRTIVRTLQRPNLVRRAIALAEVHPDVVDKALTLAGRSPELIRAVIETDDGAIAEGAIGLAAADPRLARRTLALLDREPGLGSALAQFVRSGGARTAYGAGGVPSAREASRLLDLAERAPGVASRLVGLASALPPEATSLALLGTRLVPQPLLRLGASIIGR